MKRLLFKNSDLLLASEDYSQPVSLQAKAHAVIKSRILSGEYPAGVPLSEESLATELSMSRTPIRHAFLELAGQGLLDHIPGRGVSVSRIDVQKMLDITEVQQCLLEWCVPRLCRQPDVDLTSALKAYDRQIEAAERGDSVDVLLESRRMDVALTSLTGNQEMVRIMQEISDLLIHAASQVLSTSDKYKQAIKEHASIIDALHERDAEKALEAVQRHCTGVRRRLLNVSE